MTNRTSFSPLLSLPHPLSSPSQVDNVTFSLPSVCYNILVDRPLHFCSPAHSLLSQVSLAIPDTRHPPPMYPRRHESMHYPHLLTLSWYHCCFFGSSVLVVRGLVFFRWSCYYHSNSKSSESAPLCSVLLRLKVSSRYILECHPFILFIRYSSQELSPIRG